MSFPNVAEVIWDWETSIKFRVLKKVINDFEVEEKSLVDTFILGVLEPMPVQKLLIKPEGQRSWKWWTLWTQQELNLDMVLEDESCKTYRVMTAFDWNQAGYYEYELAQGVPVE